MSELKGRIECLLKKKGGPNVTSAIATVKTLLALIEESEATTIYEQDKQLKEAVRIMKQEQLTSLTSNNCCEWFMRFISNIKDETRDEEYDQCKKLMLERGDKFVRKIEISPQKIARLGSPHIKENAVILVHSRSRVVLELLIAASKTKKFKVFVTESRPDHSGMEMEKDLRENDIEAEWILDSAVGYIMERIDLVLVGAEGVVASGGIINKIGTFAVAMAAKAFNKPVYVAAESFKFYIHYPLNQRDLSNHCAYSSNARGEEKTHPLIDYTPAEYLTLLFTDIGILTPTAVSDELIKLA